RLESLINQFWNDDMEIWEDAFRTLHIYDTATRVSTFESWDEFMGVWSRSSRETSTYDTLGLEIEYISEFWSGTEWVVSVKVTKTYGPNGIESETIELWNGTEFVLQSRALTTYDGEGCLVEELEQMWDGSDWVDYYRYTYTYESTTTAVDDFFDVAPFSLDVYPNPFADVVNLTVVMDDFESVRVEVYDILGRKADTIYSGNLPVGKSELSWSAQGSAAGTYFVTVRTSDYTATTPIVVQ
ncbi:MAG: T9SS type A sorting domain-containing protein, partial [Rhodothermales bacterium]|nr:T9SS type A sorting domain-containing protein [Rhodothermales bacterium]